MKEITPDTIWSLWRSIQKEKPLVHCITNIVTVNDCANILLAAGASPTMAHDVREASEVTEGCRSLVCNLGATEAFDAMLLAGVRARELSRPVILDPVGAAGIACRREKSFLLMDKVRPGCIRGNYSEIRALALNQKIICGVDAAETDLLKDREEQAAAALVQDFARKYHTIAIASGEMDLISDGTVVYKVHNGSPMMSRITGSGCMSSALLGACLGIEYSVEAAASACIVMGICGEIAEKKTKRLHGGTMTFRNQLIDAVSLLEKQQLEALKLFQ